MSAAMHMHTPQLLLSGCIKPFCTTKEIAIDLSDFVTEVKNFKNISLMFTYVLKQLLAMESIKLIVRFLLQYQSNKTKYSTNTITAQQTISIATQYMRTENDNNEILALQVIIHVY